MPIVIPRTLTDSDLVVGHVFRAKVPAHLSANSFGDLTDRLIVNLTLTHVQYDARQAPFGEFLPEITIAEFLEWASYEIQNHPREFKVVG